MEVYKILAESPATVFHDGAVTGLEMISPKIFEEVLQTTDGLVPAIQTAIETQSGADILTPWPGFDVVRNYESFYPLKDYVSQEVLDNALVNDTRSVVHLHSAVNNFI